jgi:hypothetical protein
VPRALSSKNKDLDCGAKHPKYPKLARVDKKDGDLGVEKSGDAIPVELGASQLRLRARAGAMKSKHAASLLRSSG